MSVRGRRVNWGIVIWGVGALLRFAGLGRQGLFLDEAWSWAVSRSSLKEIMQLSLRDPHPPFYYILLKGWLYVFPSSEAGLRGLSVLCSLTSLLLVMVFVKKKWNIRASVYAGWFMALSSFDVYYAQDARMYTLLGLLWLLAYILLIEALNGNGDYFLLLLGIVNLLLTCTHFYGLLSVVIQMAFLLGLWSWCRWRRRPFPLSIRWLIWSIILTVIGVTLSLRWLWSFKTSGAGGAWVPDFHDLLVLFSLLSVGLTSARLYFLDGGHLTLPVLSALPFGIWLIVGVVVSGIFAVYGIVREWKSNIARREEVLLSFSLIFAPVAIAFCYAAMFHTRTWAYKPFLGVAYLFYMWIGIGLGYMPYYVRRSAVVVVLIVSLASFVPYFTCWQKTDAAAALRTLPLPDKRGIVLLSRAYTSPVASYYLSSDVNVWGVAKEKNEYTLVRISFDDSPLGRPFMDRCEALDGITDVWVYGPAYRVRREYALWPGCVAEKRLWLFEDGKWSLVLDHSES